MLLMTKEMTWYPWGDLADSERDACLEANIALAACDLDVFTPSVPRRP
jgi:hypothetical protein